MGEKRIVDKKKKKKKERALLKVFRVLRALNDDWSAVHTSAKVERTNERNDLKTIQLWANNKYEKCSKHQLSVNHEVYLIKFKIYTKPRFNMEANKFSVSYLKKMFIDCS